MSNKEALHKAQDNIASMRDDIGKMKRALTVHHKVLGYLLDRMEIIDHLLEDRMEIIVDPDPGFELTDLTEEILRLAAKLRNVEYYDVHGNVIVKETK